MSVMEILRQDPKLNVGGRARNERLDTAKAFVVFRRGVMAMQSSNDRAVREGRLLSR